MSDSIPEPMWPNTTIIVDGVVPLDEVPQEQDLPDDGDSLSMFMED